MIEKTRIEGFLHFRTDLGDGVQTGVVFSGCREHCTHHCCPFSFLEEHRFEDGSEEKHHYSSEELAAYLSEEKTLYYTKPLGITFLGKEPLLDPFFCKEVAVELRRAGMDLTVYTCGMCSSTAFELLDGLVNSYVLRVFTLRENTPYHGKESLRAIRLLEERKQPFRLLIPVLKGVNDGDAEDFASFAATLENVKSVVLDFSRSAFSPEEEKAYKAPFLERDVPLY